MTTTTRFHSPADTLDALALLLAQDYDHFTVCASIRVRADWGSRTATAYEGDVISKEPNGGIYLWFWRSTCDQYSDGPAVRVYSVHSLSEDTEEACRALLGTIGSPPHAWAVMLDGSWTETAADRVIADRYAE